MSSATKLLQSYYHLAKPGIIYGNLLTAAAGFLFGSAGNISLWTLLSVLAGTGLVIGSACVVNNVIDRDIDARMDRTKKRALVQGNISPTYALAYSAILGLAGFTILIIYTNWLTVLLGAIGFIDYIVLYGLSKRRSVHGTLVGTIAGATPIAAGYTAATNSFDRAALILFSIMVFWQMAHFYAIGLYRLKDYQRAGLPILPVKYGLKKTKSQILVYIGLFLLTVNLLAVLGYISYIFLFIMFILTAVWFWRGLQGFNEQSARQWGKKMFLFSLIVLLILSVCLTLSSILT